MAIDDNTVYGLTGAQVKELPGKIEAVKGLARELTTDDYNYPTGNPTSVALWLLEPGVYSAPAAGVSVNYGNPMGTAPSAKNEIYIIGDSNTGNSPYKVAFFLRGSYSSPTFVRYTNLSNGSASTTSIPLVVDDLTSSSPSSALSANQGRVLKGLIDAIQVPTKTSDLTNDSNFVTSTEMTTALAGKADTNDIPTALSELTNDINAVSDANYVHTDNNYTTVEKNKLAGIASGAEANVQANWNESDTTSDAYIQNKPSLASVATSGSYADLTNKPTIPVVNNATLTIQRNGTTLGTFTANSSTGTTVNIEIPTVFTTNEWNALWA